MDIEKVKEKIDDIDAQLVELFKKRMDACGELAQAKNAAGLPAVDAAGYRKKINEVRRQAGDELAGYAGVLYSTVLELGRCHQQALMHGENPLCAQISAALENTPKQFPESGLIACQGVEGAYSQQAAEKLFAHPDIMYFNNFEGVFSAIDKGFCSYGVLPLENSTAGSVNAIYDLMQRYNFSIVRSVRLKVDHNLLVRRGTKLEEIKELCSHEQAFSQCGEFLKSMTGVKITVCENTAAAAKMVAESGRSDIAAISSRSCAELYGLESLRDAIQDKDNNYTRFICITKNLEIYPGADRTSVMLTVPHKPGSLYRIMARINALSVNLSKLESRPIPERDFEFMFYFDLDTSVYSPQFVELMGQLGDMCETFQYLGSYSEIV